MVANNHPVKKNLFSYCGNDCLDGVHTVFGFLENIVDKAFCP